MNDSLPEFDLEHYLPYQFTVIAARLSAALAEQYKSQFGISIAEWRVLLNVGYSKDLSVRDIEQRVSLEKSKVSRAASKLQTKGYLIKHIDDGDRRLLKLALTPKGSALLQELSPIADTYQAKLLGQLGPQKDSLIDALNFLMKETE